MQTILVLQSASAGVVYLNGRMLGEIDSEHTLSLPVCPTGALILEMHPFGRNLLPIALRLTLSHGVPILSAENDDRYAAALWGSGVLEIELIPQRLPSADAAQPLFEHSGIRFSLQNGDAPQILCETPAGRFVHPLPHGAQTPALTPLADALLFSGKAVDEEYALLLSRDAAQTLLSLSGRGITLSEGGTSLRILRSAGDSLGHGQLETWKPTAQGWAVCQSEPMWYDGTPHYPQTPEATAVAAVEAAQLGLMNEAQSYFAPMCCRTEALERAGEYDGCVPLRYPLPGGEAAVGLMKMDGSLLRITPIRYKVTCGGAHGAWQLTELELSEN